MPGNAIAPIRVQDNFRLQCNGSFIWPVFWPVQILGSAVDGTEEQGAQFQQLGDLVVARAGEGTVLAMGDFNAEPGWRQFADFLDRTGLEPGPNPPTTRSVAGIGFAIDQVLAGPGAAVASVRTGPDAGSDHLPLIAEIARGP